MHNLVFIEGNMIFTNSIEIAKGVNHSHASVLKLLRNSMDLYQLRDLKSRSLKTKGREAEVFNLTEEQATLLIALMKNTPIVRQFKSALVKEFFKLRRFRDQSLLQKQNPEYKEKRIESKVMRKECTDTIQKFIEYAKAQGSKSAEMYYMNFSRMELTGLFLLKEKYPNARELMDMKQLDLIKMADVLIAMSLDDSMKKNIPYKECFQIAKEKISTLATLFPKSPLQLLLNKD